MVTAMRALLLTALMASVVAVASALQNLHPAQAVTHGNTAQHRALQHHESSYIPADRAADSYAIYSLLMPGWLFRNAAKGNATRWAIAKQTVTFAEMNPRIDPRGALKPPSGNEKGFHQAVQDFELHQNLRYTLQPKLSFGHAYDLLDAQQIHELREAKSSIAPDSRLQSRYAAYPGVTFFSAVYFSNDQKAALVYMNDWCGVLCSQSEWIFLEKKNDHWQRMSGITVPGA